MFNNASAQSAIERFLSECKHFSKGLQALAIHIDRYFTLNSKMDSIIIMGFHEGLCMQYFRFYFGMTMFVSLGRNMKIDNLNCK